MPAPMPTHCVRFEMVSATGPGARFYRWEEPICAPSAVPDQYWHEVRNEGAEDQIRDQASTLAEWAESGTQLIRNVRMFEIDRSDREVSI